MGKSQFSVLSSQFSVLSSQFSVLSSQFSVLRVGWVLDGGRCYFSALSFLGSAKNAAATLQVAAAPLVYSCSASIPRSRPISLPGRAAVGHKRHVLSKYSISIDIL